MIHRPPSYFRARQERADRAERLDAMGISDVAVLEVDGVDDLEHRPFPRQMALAFADGRPGLAWLVAPESLWPLAGKPPREVGLTLKGHGEHPIWLGPEFVAQISGCRVYSRYPDDTTQWLALFFQAGLVNKRLDVRDVRDLTTPSGTSIYDLPGPEVRRLDRETALLHSETTNPSADAARAVHRVRVLQALRAEREQTLAREAEAKRTAAPAEAGLTS